MDAELEAAALRFADSMSERIREAALPARFKAIITIVSAGTASDGNAEVTISRQGRTFLVNGYSRNYTPVVGHTVICDRLDNQVFIAYSPIGQP